MRAKATAFARTYSAQVPVTHVIIEDYTRVLENLMLYGSASRGRIPATVRGRGVTRITYTRRLNGPDSLQLEYDPVARRKQIYKARRDKRRKAARQALLSSAVDITESTS